MANELRTGTGSGNTVYAHILNAASRRWNGTAFEVYASGNYTNYRVALTEQGSSGVYVGDFPTAITDEGEYGVYYYVQQGASAAEGDPIAGIGSVEWDGSTATPSGASVSGELAVSEWVAYIQRSFKRSDKTTEVYDATNEAIAEIRRKIRTSREETETVITDTIDTLGQYKLNVESNFNMMLSDVFIRDSGNGTYLIPISKSQYDLLYGKWGTGNSERGLPRHYCLFGGQIHLGPVPDSLNYVYVMTYGKDDHVLVDASTTSVPFTTTDYREILKHGVLYRCYLMVGNKPEAADYKPLWDQGLFEMDQKERRNRRNVTIMQYRDI